MFVDRNFARYVVLAEEPIALALRKIDDNRSRIVFCIDSAGTLVGAISDGDVRRWLLAEQDRRLDATCAEVANRACTTARFGEPPAAVGQGFRPGIEHIPLLDRRGRIQAVAMRASCGVAIGEHLIGPDSPTFVVAEIGNNHNGSAALARELVDASKEAGASAVKFQLRDMESLYRNRGAAGDAREDIGVQYTLDLLSRFQLSVTEMLEVLEHCARRSITALCTPWDIASAAVLDEAGIAGFKVASADLTNHELLGYLASTGRPIVMSTGMSTEAEIGQSIALLREAAAPYVLLHCNSTYPAPFKDINLNYMVRLGELGSCPVGYSGHERGWHVALAAVAMGARVIEKHVTIDRSMEGNDHRVSLLPAELAAMVAAIGEVEAAMGSAVARSVTQGERMNRESLAKSLVARVALDPGEVVSDEVIQVRSPGRGLQPNRRGELVGVTLRRSLAPGDFFYESDLGEGPASARPYAFRRPFGIPVRYHDYAALAAQTNPDFLEFHMSYRDLEADPLEAVPDQLDLGLVVHCPELFAGDHLLDLASEDAGYRKRSIHELGRVIEVTRTLARRFRPGADTLLVTNVGGFTRQRPLPASARMAAYERLGESLAELDSGGVEVIAQTLPPFPWLFGGQMFSNLFVDPADGAAFAAQAGLRLCLDVSHTALAAQHLRRSLSELVEAFAPLAAHLHVVDASGVDGEGLQIGEGFVDFATLGAQLDRLAPGVGFIPEIWQGHKDGGQAFWVALDRLEGHL